MRRSRLDVMIVDECEPNLPLFSEWIVEEPDTPVQTLSRLSLANVARCQAPVSRPCNTRKQKLFQVRGTGCVLGMTTARGFSPQIIHVLKEERSTHASLRRKSSGDRPFPSTRRSSFYADVDAGNLEKPACVGRRRKPSERRRGVRPLGSRRRRPLLGVNIFADYHGHREGMAGAFGAAAPLENL